MDNLEIGAQGRITLLTYLVHSAPGSVESSVIGPGFVHISSLSFDNERLVYNPAKP